MPKKLMCVAAGKLAWQEYDQPQLAPGEVRVRSEYASAKHGTEMALFKGYRPDRYRPPAAVGNMMVGRIVEVGPDAAMLAAGDRVCLYTGFRQTWAGPEARCWKMPEGMSWKSAVCLDPADFAFCALRDGHVRIGDVVAVFGLGAIGLMAVQLARLAGAEAVIGVDPLPNRRQVAEQLGAEPVLDPTACDVGREIRETAGGRGADVVIEYSGAAGALNDALRAIAYGGNVVCGAWPPPYPAGVDFGAEAHHNVPNITFSRACSQPDRDHPRWDEPRIYAACWRMLCEGRITGEPIVQPVVAFDDLPTEYPKIATHPQTNVKLGVEF
jgi:threonine dehydrogenase-like Zn-dependent dehydrogenase